MKLRKEEMGSEPKLIVFHVSIMLSINFQFGTEDSLTLSDTGGGYYDHGIFPRHITLILHKRKFTILTDF